MKNLPIIEYTAKEEGLTKIYEEYKDCQKCTNLCASRTNVVFGVVVSIVEVGVIVIVAFGDDVIVVINVVVFTVKVDGWVDLAQETKTIDITMRQVSAIKIALLFISSSYFTKAKSWKLTQTIFSL